MAAAPSATVILADLGAEVIKVEPPTGDPWWHGHRLAGMPSSGIAYTTFVHNRTKKSVALDLKKPDAQAALLKLAENADVFLTNSPRRVQEQLNHTYENIRKVNPQVVYASINGFGLKGPDKDAPGFDMTAWYARTGIMEELRVKNGDPIMMPVGAGDQSTATALFSAVMTGLFHRERTGEGSQVSTSLMNNGAWANANFLQAALVGAPPMQKFHREDFPNPVTGGIYKTSEGRYIIIVELNPSNVVKLFDALGAEHLKADERFATPASRFTHHKELFEEMQNIIGGLELTEVSRRFNTAGVNFSVVQTTTESAHDAHMMENGVYPEVEGCAGIRTVDSPIQVEGMEKVKPQKPPAVGSHSMTVLADLGYSEEDIHRLVADGVVGIPR